MPPGKTIDYYRAATRTMGGPKATKDFFRLLMMPGVGHCDYGGLAGADVIDGLNDLKVLEAWRERDEAPDELVAYRLRKYDGSSSFWPQRTPPDQANVAFARPLFPYPAVARFGSGDPRAASSFRPVAPRN